MEQQRYEKQHQSVQIPYMLVAKSSFLLKDLSSRAFGSR